MRVAEVHVQAEVRGGTHVGMYDLPQNVTPAVAKLTQFFGEHLAG